MRGLHWFYHATRSGIIYYGLLSDGNFDELGIGENGEVGHIPTSFEPRFFTSSFYYLYTRCNFKLWSLQVLIFMKYRIDNTIGEIIIVGVTCFNIVWHKKGSYIFIIFINRNIKSRTARVYYKNIFIFFLNQLR